MEKKKYLTKGVNEKIPLAVQLVLWELASVLPSEKQDYLQVFKLTWKEGLLTVVHSQEVPRYEKTHSFALETTEKTEKAETTEKVYIIDSGDYVILFSHHIFEISIQICFFFFFYTP